MRITLSKLTSHPLIGRSPCPGLNALANHGFLPRSGKSIDLPTLRSAVAAAYHYEPTAFDTAFNDAIALNSTSNPTSLFPFSNCLGKGSDIDIAVY